MSLWVTNASPLIFLAKLDRLSLLQGSADRVVVPQAVVREIRQQRDSASAQLDAALESWLEEREAESSNLLALLTSEVGAGEAAALCLACDLAADRVILDDLEARRWARKLDLEVVGTLGILLAAKLRGQIPSLRHEIDALQAQGFRAGAPLIGALLKEAGEETGAPNP